MSFFIRGKNAGRGGRGGKRKPEPQAKAFSKPDFKKKRPSSDDEITSDEDLMSENEQEKWEVKSASEDEEETAQEKRLRLTKKYLEEIERQEREKAENEEIDDSAVANRLKEDVLEQAGKLRRTVAEKYIGYESVSLLRCKDHKLSVTCTIVSPDGNFIYSASKDCTIVKWSLAEGKKVAAIKSTRVSKKGEKNNSKGHSAIIQSLALSSDGKFLASGDVDKVLHIWDAATMNWVHTFKGHRGGITGLAFRKGTHTLYSASTDRSIKVWNLDEMTYVETLLGHQDAITAIDALTRERAITAGGRDTSVRIWKIVEESHLVFNGHHGSIDCVKLINEEHFVTCGDDGMLSLWGSMKKKPLFSVPAAHGHSSTSNQPNWISSVAALHNTDLVASGSSDGQIRLWHCGDGFRSLKPVLTVPVEGFVNSLHFTPDGKMLVAGVGQEHRLGRWWREPAARNGVHVIKFDIQKD